MWPEPILLDGHGKTLLSNEKWSNIHLENVDKKTEISGEIPGGWKSWESLLESSFIYLLHITSINDILARIYHLVYHYPTSAIDHYPLTFFHHSHLLALHHFIIYLQQYLEAKIADIDHHPHQYEITEEILMKYDQLLDLLAIFQTTVTSCLQVTSSQQLHHTLPYNHHLSSQPSLKLANYPQLEHMEGQWDGNNHHRRGSMQLLELDEEAIEQARLAAAATATTRKEQLKESLQSATSGIKLEIFGAANLLDDSSDSSDNDDDDDRHAGSYDGKQAAKGEDASKGTLATVAVNNQQPIEAAAADDHHHQQQQVLFPPPPRLPPPIPRIAPGISLLLSPVLYSHRHQPPTSLLDYDMMEVARQWTLLDHALFRSLSMGNILHSQIYPNKPWPIEEDHQAAAGASLDSNLVDQMCAQGGMKRLIDRFNAASTWITYSILEAGSSPEMRSGILSKFISLAQCLQQLGNFHGLMVVLTALQQGCITRLTISFDMLPKTVLQQWSMLKKLMAGSKNYSRYREELQRLYLSLPFERAHRHRHYLPHPSTAVPSDWKEMLKKRFESMTMPTVPFPHSHRFPVTVASSSSNANQSLHLGAEDDDHHPVRMGGGVSSSHSNTAVTVSSTIAISTMNDDNYKYETLEAIVPHLGAHIAALTAIGEALQDDYLSIYPHLYNTQKWKQTMLIIVPLHRLQSLTYSFAPIRAIQASLHSHWKKYGLTRNANISNEMAKRLYIMSEACESSEMISQYQEEMKQAMVKRQQTPNSRYFVNANGGNSPMNSSKQQQFLHGKQQLANQSRQPGIGQRVASNVSMTGKDPAAAVTAVKKTAAYERIQRSSSTMGDGLSGSSPHGKGRGLTRSPSRLLRILSIFSVTNTSSPSSNNNNNARKQLAKKKQNSSDNEEESEDNDDEEGEGESSSSDSSDSKSIDDDKD